MENQHNDSTAIPTIYNMDLLRKKRDGLELTTDEIKHFVRSVSEETISTAQIGAFLMAVFLRGLTRAELHALTTAMRFSGDVFNSKPLHKFTIDKHSTGGVGDKTSLLIAPIVAAAGLAPMRSLATSMRKNPIASIDPPRS